MEGGLGPAQWDRDVLNVVRRGPRRLAALALDHPLTTVIAWLAVAAGVLVAAHACGGAYDNDLSLPGSEAAEGADLVAAHTQPTPGYGARLVLHDPDGLAADAAVISDLSTQLQTSGAVLGVGNALASDNLSADGTTSLLPVRLAKAPRDLDQAERGALLDAARLPAGVEASWAGSVGDVLAGGGGHRRAEVIGLGAALVLLLLVFGSLAAAVLPVVAAMIGVSVALGLLDLLAAGVDLGTSAPTLAAMIGIGCGIDYALLIVTRARQHLVDGAEPPAAVRRALRSTGPAILTAAATVALALLGLYAAGAPFLGSMGLAAVVALATAALAAVSLAPAVLVLLGGRVDRLSVRRVPRAESDATAGGPWDAHARLVTRHPAVVAVASCILLGALTLPLVSMRLGHLDDSAAPVGSMSRTAYDRTTAAFGPGAPADLLAVVELAGDANRDRLGEAAALIEEEPGVATVTPFVVSRDGFLATASVVPTSGAQDAATGELVATLRGPVAEDVERVVGGRLLITGQTAAQADFAARITSRTPWVMGIVIASAFLLLTLTFRSPVVAAKAAVMNVISVGASYGVVVAVFQWQWGSALLGLDHSVPIESFVPMMMFVIVFGLSTDYEVFLISRIRQEWQATGDNAASVRAGLAGTARVISVAAAIMVCVFLAFTQQGDVAITMLATGLAVSVVIDATVVRLMLVPAAMILLGPANWWAPGWSQRGMRRRRR